MTGGLWHADRALDWACLAGMLPRRRQPSASARSRSGGRPRQHHAHQQLVTTAERELESADAVGGGVRSGVVREGAVYREQPGPGNMGDVYVVIEGRRMPVRTLLERGRAVMAARRAGYERLPVMVDDVSGRPVQIDAMNVSSNGWWLEALADRLGDWLSRKR